MQFFKISFERTIKGILSQSGFYKAHMVDVERLINNASGLINPRLTVETILTAGAAITEIVDDVAGSHFHRPLWLHAQQDCGSSP